MKISGAEKAILAVTAAFLLLAAGYFLGGRGSDAPYTVDVQTKWTEEVDDDAGVATDTRLININTATVDQLQKIPGIGPTKAAEIVADRRANGPFRIPEDLTRVSGISEGMLSEILKYITVE